MNSSPKPFECTYSPQFAELLHKLGISLAISTYQAGKVVFLSPVETDRLIQLTRTFENAMGMAVSNNTLAVSVKNEVTVLRNRPELASSYPKKRGVYDGIYIPSARYNTGYLALHDMEYMNEKLTAVNTLFSCLSYIDDKFSFTPFWQPPFITELAPEDRCHLNGIAVENNEIKYLTALGNTNSMQGWRDKKMNGGILMEYPSGKIILNGLAMPHSPRIYNGKLYLLNSAQGELICFDPEKGTSELIVNLGGFARGMSRYGDYLFIGVSKLRHNSKAFSDLEIAKTSFAGVIAVYLPYKSIVGSFKYEMSVDEIYDVKVIEGSVRPSLLSPDMAVHKQAISTPQGSYWSKTEDENKQTSSNINQQANKFGKFTFQLLKNVHGNDLIKNLSVLVYPDFIPELKRNKFNGFLTALLTLADGKAVAMSVFEATEDRNAQIHSIFVLPAFRKQKIAKNMLMQIEKIFSENKIAYAEASYNDKVENAEAIRKLFKNSNLINLTVK